MISLIHEESNNKISDYVEAKQELNSNTRFLQKTFSDIQKENITYKNIINDKTTIL